MEKRNNENIETLKNIVKHQIEKKLNNLDGKINDISNQLKEVTKEKSDILKFKDDSEKTSISEGLINEKIIDELKTRAT